jgi:hypothetical protein
LAKIQFISGNKTLFELALSSDTADVQAAVAAGADLLKTYTYNKGRSMGVYRTGDTLGALTVKAPKKGADGWECYVTYTGRNRKGNRNAEVAFINEYGKRHQPARAFNRLAVETGEQAIVQRMGDVLLKDK